jgi:serine/threonine protein kinase
VHVLDHGWLSSPVEYYFIDMELCEFNLHDYIYGDRSALFKFPPSDILDAVLVPQDDFVCMKVENVYCIMTDVTNGLEYIHSCGQVHRDLKPKNSMVCVDVANA